VIVDIHLISDIHGNIYIYSFLAAITEEMESREPFIKSKGVGTRELNNKQTYTMTVNPL
jgi:hypothetical protein